MSDDMVGPQRPSFFRDRHWGDKAPYEVRTQNYVGEPLTEPLVTLFLNLNNPKAYFKLPVSAPISEFSYTREKMDAALAFKQASLNGEIATRSTYPEYSYGDFTEEDWQRMEDARAALAAFAAELHA